MKHGEPLCSVSFTTRPLPSVDTNTHTKAHQVASPVWCLVLTPKQFYTVHQLLPPVSSLIWLMGWWLVCAQCSKFQLLSLRFEDLLDTGVAYCNPWVARSLYLQRPLFWCQLHFPLRFVFTEVVRRWAHHAALSLPLHYAAGGFKISHCEQWAPSNEPMSLLFSPPNNYVRSWLKACASCLELAL